MTADNFGAWLQKQLNRRQWTQTELAKRAGVGQTTVSAWLRGARLPDALSCDKIADALFLSRDEVLARAGLRPVEHDDSDLVRELTELLRRIDWTPDRARLARTVLTGMATHTPNAPE